jgi:phasin
MIALEKDDVDVSETEVKAGLNGNNAFVMPWFGFPKTALAGPFGEFAEHGAARAQQNYDNIKVASAQMAEALRETYSSQARTATDYSLKVIEISRTNTASAMNFFAELLNSKSVTDVISVSAVQARKTFDSASAQNQALWELTHRFATETGAPIRKHVEQVLQKAD